MTKQIELRKTIIKTLKKHLPKNFKDFTESMTEEIVYAVREIPELKYFLVECGTGDEWWTEARFEMRKKESANSKVNYTFYIVFHHDLDFYEMTVEQMADELLKLNKLAKECKKVINQ